jgi:hypothetical protein
LRCKGFFRQDLKKSPRKQIALVNGRAFYKRALPVTFKHPDFDWQPLIVETNRSFTQAVFSKFLQLET